MTTIKHYIAYTNARGAGLAHRSLTMAAAERKLARISGRDGERFIVTATGTYSPDKVHVSRPDQIAQFLTTNALDRIPTFMAPTVDHLHAASAIQHVLAAIGAWLTLTLPTPPTFTEHGFDAALDLPTCDTNDDEIGLEGSDWSALDHGLDHAAECQPTAGDHAAAAIGAMLASLPTARPPVDTSAEEAQVAAMAKVKRASRKPATAKAPADKVAAKVRKVRAMVEAGGGYEAQLNAALDHAGY